MEVLTSPKHIAIIGRPNVGKSTLLNRLVGRRVAIVQDQEGVTRDWQIYDAKLQDLSLRIVDTPGLGLEGPDFLEKVQAFFPRILKAVDGVLFMTDGKSGWDDRDLKIAKWLHKQGVPVIFVANKCEKEDLYREYNFYNLGFGAPLEISALHGLGLYDLSQSIKKLPLRPKETLTGPCQNVEFRLIVLGRPNVGKSTFINFCLGYERLLAGPEAGITRDSVEVPLTWRGRKIALVDTAGLRKKARVYESVEKMSCQASVHSLMFGQVVLLLIDCTQGLEKQDLTILEKVFQEGRGVVIGLNKWDQVEDQEGFYRSIKRCLANGVKGGQHIPLVPLSALTGRGVSGLWDAIFHIYDSWCYRISTGRLNKWLQEKLQAHPPILLRGRPIRPKYISQIKARPPTFTLFGNQVGDLPDHYIRYLLNGLVSDFNLQGTSPRLLCRETKNPYHTKVN